MRTTRARLYAVMRLGSVAVVCTLNDLRQGVMTLRRLQAWYPVHPFPNAPTQRTVARRVSVRGLGVEQSLFQARPSFRLRTLAMACANRQSWGGSDDVTAPRRH